MSLDCAEDLDVFRQIAKEHSACHVVDITFDVYGGQQLKQFKCSRDREVLYMLDPIDVHGAQYACKFMQLFYVSVLRLLHVGCVDK